MSDHSNESPVEGGSFRRGDAPAKDLTKVSPMEASFSCRDACVFEAHMKKS